MTCPTILSHKRAVMTPFGLLGNDENALSFALGYTFAKCLPLLQHFLRRIGIGGLRRDSLSKVEISLQRHEHGGITDIEISLPGKLFVVVEAKIGLSIPTLDQCLKYVPRFKHQKAAKRRLVALVASPATSFIESYRSQCSELKPLLTAFHWMDLIPDCAQLVAKHRPTTEAGQWVRAFHRFLEQEYTMRSFTDEVWIVSANTQPLWDKGMSFYDTHTKGRIYYCKGVHAKRPLYIAFRVHGHVSAIQRVLRVEHEARPIDFIPELKDVSNEWPKESHTIWVLDEPTPLPKPIPSGDATMRARRCGCDLDVLLSSPTIRLAEERMKKRHAASVNC